MVHRRRTTAGEGFGCWVVEAGRKLAVGKWEWRERIGGGEKIRGKYGISVGCDSDDFLTMRGASVGLLHFDCEEVGSTGLSVALLGRKREGVVMI